MKNEHRSNENAPAVELAKDDEREFKPTITRMERLTAEAGSVAAALSIGIGVAGKWG